MENPQTLANNDDERKIDEVAPGGVGFEETRRSVFEIAALWRCLRSDDRAALITYHLSKVSSLTEMGLFHFLLQLFADQQWSPQFFAGLVGTIWTVLCGSLDTIYREGGFPQDLPSSWLPVTLHVCCISEFGASLPTETETSVWIEQQCIVSVNFFRPISST